MEMAIVMLVMGLLLGGLMMPLSQQMVNSRISETKNTLNLVNDALLGFAAQKGRLPCPDTNNDGRENGPPCVNVEGYVPWADLGVGQFDGWHHRLRYRADNNFTPAGIIPDPPNTTSNLQIQSRAGIVLSVANPDAPAAIIFSCGKNGIPDMENDANGTPNIALICDNPGAANAIYIQDIFAQNFYDDQLIILSKSVLINRMVSAGIWP